MIETRLLGQEVVFEDWEAINERVGDLETSDQGGTIEAIFMHPTLGLRFLIQLSSNGRLIEVSSREILKKPSQPAVPYKWTARKPPASAVGMKRRP